jgi:hypothetical protein
MTQQELREALTARGGGADVWVVCVEDANETRLTGRPVLVPKAAFWTRGEAYSFAHARHAAVAWHHAYVFRAPVDAAWAAGDAPRELTFETVFTAATGEPRASVTPRVLAALFGA